MAERPGEIDGPRNDGVVLVKWDTMLNTDTGEGWAHGAKFADKTVQVTWVSSL